MSQHVARPHLRAVRRRGHTRLQRPAERVVRLLGARQAPRQEPLHSVRLRQTRGARMRLSSALRWRVRFRRSAARLAALRTACAATQTAFRPVAPPKRRTPSGRAQATPAGSASGPNAASVTKTMPYKLEAHLCVA